MIQNKLRCKVCSLKKKTTIDYNFILKKLQDIINNGNLEKSSFLEILKPFISSEQLSVVGSKSVEQVLLFTLQFILKTLLNTHTLNVYTARIMPDKSYFLRHIETGEEGEEGSRFLLNTTLIDNQPFVTIKALITDDAEDLIDRRLSLPVMLDAKNKMYISVPQKMDSSGKYTSYRKISVYFENGFCYLKLNSTSFYSEIINQLMLKIHNQEIIFFDTIITKPSTLIRGVQTDLMQNLSSAIADNVVNKIYTAIQAKQLVIDLLNFLYGNRTFIPLYKGGHREGLPERLTYAQTNNLIPLYEKLLDAIKTNRLITFNPDNTCYIDGKKLYTFKSYFESTKKNKLESIQILLGQFSDIFTSYRIKTRKEKLDKLQLDDLNYDFSTSEQGLKGTIHISPYFKKNHIYTEIKYAFSEPLVADIETIVDATQIRLLTTQKDVLLSDNTIRKKDHLEKLSISDDGVILSILLKQDTFGQNLDVLLRPLIGINNELPFIKFNKTRFSSTDFNLPPDILIKFWEFLSSHKLLSEKNEFISNSKSVGLVCKWLQTTNFDQNLRTQIKDTLVDNIKGLPFLWITNGKLILLQDFSELFAANFIYNIYKNQCFSDDELNTILRRNLASFKKVFELITTTSTLSKNILPLINKINSEIAGFEKKAAYFLVD